MESEISIYYYMGSGRKTLTGRVMRGEKRLFDRTTGIKVEKSDGFSLDTKRFAKNHKKNQALSKFETEIFERFDELKYLHKGEVPSQSFIDSMDKKKSIEPFGDKELTLTNIHKAFKEKALNGKLYSKRTGKRLSDATHEAHVYGARLAERYLASGGPDIDIGRFNLSTMNALGKKVVKNHYEEFISGLKNFLIAEKQDDSSIFKNLYRIKFMVNHFADLHEIELGELMKNLKYPKPKKDPVVLSNAQVEFVLKNYERMRSDCTTIRQREALDFWYTALILNPRRGDMDLWDKDNLFTGDDGLKWIRFIPHKTKNTSGVKVEALVPATLLVIFDRNIKKYGKLLPKIEHNLNLNIKRVASRYEIFQNEIQIFKKGKFKTVKVCDYVHIHMMRGSGMTHKLENGWSELETKESSGHTYDSESFKAYVKISSQAKQKVASAYHKQLGL
jgi:hypothetical protein